jgi:hypothetical protein
MGVSSHHVPAASPLGKMPAHIEQAAGLASEPALMFGRREVLLLLLEFKPWIIQLVA